MTPVDRPALAAALRVATPEVLRRLAEERAVLANTIAALGTPDADAQARDHRIMAALALAVAEWTERPARLAPYDNSWDDDGVAPLPWALRVPMTMDYTHHASLPAALAALVEGAA